MTLPPKDEYIRLIYDVPDEEPHEEVTEELVRLSQKLYELLPDITLGPSERLERLARVVPASILMTEHHKTAATKLGALRRRLDELVSEDVSYEAKIDFLVELTKRLVPGREPRLFKRLEELGDHRRTDCGY